MKNSADQSGCHEPKPKAEVDDTLWGLRNSSYLTKAKFALLFIQNIKGENELFVFLLTKNDTTSSPGLGFSIKGSKPCSMKILRVLIFANFADWPQSAKISSRRKTNLKVQRRKN